MVEKYIRFCIFKMPESRFKEALKKFFFRHYNSLYSLNTLIKSCRIINRNIQLELINGIKLCALSNIYNPGAYGISTKHDEFKYANPFRIDKLVKMNVEYFADFLSIIRTIFVENIYQKDYLLKLGDTIIDIGANIGAFTIKASMAVGKKGRIIAIEPDPDNLAYLRKNVKVNSVKNCIIIPKGVWSKSGKMPLFKGLGSGWSSLVWERDNFRKVEVDTLDNILSESNIEKIDFIKIDIEGAEIHALEGMRKILRNNDVKLAIEAFHVVDGKPTYKTIVPQLKTWEFNVLEKSGFVYAKKK